MERRNDIPKDLLLRIMSRHKEANIIASKERSLHLRHLTVDESIREYEALCETWVYFSSQPTSGKTEKHRIAYSQHSMF
jgi:hypothetical protein